MKREGRKNSATRPADSSPSPVQLRRLRLDIGPLRLPAVAALPEPCRGWVVCATSNGGEKDSETRAGILERLRDEGFATLELDLLDPVEARDPLIRFDIPLLAERLIAATDWLRHSQQPETARVAYLAGGNAAAAALWSSVHRGNHVAAMVSLCGRPHLAEPFLGEVVCPTLLLVEGQDARLLHMNQQAARRLHGPSKLVAVACGNARQIRDGRRKLCHETVDWVATHLTRQASRPQSLATLVKSGFGLRLKRQILAALAFASFFLAVPQSASTSAAGKSEGKLKDKDLATAKADSKRQPATRMPR